MAEIDRYNGHPTIFGGGQDECPRHGFHRLFVAGSCGHAPPRFAFCRFTTFYVTVGGRLVFGRGSG